MTNRQLVFPYGIWRQCLEALFAPTGEEGFALGLARPCSRDGGLAYVVEHLVDPSSIVYENRSGGGLTLSSEASNRLNAVSAGAARLGLVPVHLHSHPTGVDTFSGYDDLHELRLHRWLRDQGQPFLWSLVNPYIGEPVARFWHNDVAHPGVVRVGLRPYASLDGGGAPALDRQRAFGPGLRLAAETLLVGIVGLGGVGLPAAEQLVLRLPSVRARRSRSRRGIESQPPDRRDASGRGPAESSGRSPPDPAGGPLRRRDGPSLHP